MAEVTIPKEKMNYTIDLLITMVTDEIAEETGKDRKEILTDFLCSKTGKALLGRPCFPVFSGGNKGSMRSHSSSVNSYRLNIVNTPFSLFYHEKGK